MEKKFNDDDRSKFLAFVWGRRRLPLKGAHWEKNFTINRKGASDPDKTFPLAHTCFFSVDIPRYTSTEIITTKFKYAMAACTSIDADGGAAIDFSGVVSRLDDEES